MYLKQLTGNVSQKNERFGIIASKQILSKRGVMSYAVANAFTAISYFVLLLDLSVRYDVWWFTYAAFW